MSMYHALSKGMRDMVCIAGAMSMGGGEVVVA